MSLVGRDATAMVIGNERYRRSQRRWFTASILVIALGIWSLWDEGDSRWLEIGLFTLAWTFSFTVVRWLLAPSHQATLIISADGLLYGEQQAVPWANVTELRRRWRGHLEYRSDGHWPIRGVCRWAPLQRKRLWITRFDPSIDRNQLVELTARWAPHVTFPAEAQGTNG